MLQHKAPRYPVAPHVHAAWQAFIAAQHPHTVASQHHWQWALGAFSTPACVKAMCSTATGQQAFVTAAQAIVSQYACIYATGPRICITEIMRRYKLPRSTVLYIAYVACNTCWQCGHYYQPIV